MTSIWGRWRCLEGSWTEQAWCTLREEATQVGICQYVLSVENLRFFLFFVSLSVQFFNNVVKYYSTMRKENRL